MVKVGGSTLTLGDIVGRIERDDGPGPVLFLLTLPVLLPLPPGVSMIMALPLLIVSPQVMIGRSRVWIPKWLAKRKIKRSDLAKSLEKIRPVLEKLEALVHPRLQGLAGHIGEYMVGAMCTFAAFVLVLPLPFANFLPSLAICVFAIGLTRKDGGLILVGYGLVVLAIAVILLGLYGARLGLGRLFALI